MFVLCSQTPEEGVTSPGTGVINRDHVVLGSLEEQEALLVTEPSVQPPIMDFLKGFSLFLILLLLCVFRICI